MAFVQLLQTLCRDKNIGKLVVPIIPDEGRTFGMEAMFRSLGIYSIVGQKYKPEDADQLAFFKEDIKGQILEEGITEAGAMSSWMASATSYANHGQPRSEEHTSELQSLMRISYAVFCLKKQKPQHHSHHKTTE